MGKVWGVLIDVTCDGCGESFKRIRAAVNQSIKQGSHMFCSWSCKNKNQGRVSFKPPTPEDFWIKVNKEPGQGPNGDCWEWTGRTNKKGYGIFSWKEMSKSGLTGSHNVLTHRISFQLTNNTPPSSLHLLHSCDNPPCCNPSHLSEGTKIENNKDMKSKNRHSHGESRSEKMGRGFKNEDINTIRAMWLLGYRQQYIGDRYDIGDKTVSYIVTYGCWKHLPVLTTLDLESFPALLAEYKQDVGSKNYYAFTPKKRKELFPFDKVMKHRKNR